MLVVAAAMVLVKGLAIVAVVLTVVPLVVLVGEGRTMAVLIVMATVLAEGRQGGERKPKLMGKV